MSCIQEKEPVHHKVVFGFLLTFALISSVLSEIPVRLVGGNTSTEGRVEIFHNGQWGTICDDNWDIQDANVICRMLGLSGANHSVVNGVFGSGTGKPIWLDEVACVGTEWSLTYCQHSGWGVHDCSHTEDAGVVCQGTALDNKAVTVQFEEDYRIVVTEPKYEERKLTKLMCRMDGVSNTSVVVHFNVDPLSTAVEGKDFILMNKSLTFPANISHNRLAIYVAILKDDYVESSEVLQIEIKKTYPNNMNVQIGQNFIAYFRIYDYYDYRPPGGGDSNVTGVNAGVPSVAVIVILVICCYCCCCRSSDRSENQNEEGHTNRAFVIFEVIRR